MATSSLLGTGWRFPLRIGPHGGFAYGGGEQDVAEAIHLILGTARGERAMLPRFGCGIHDYVFAPVDETTRGNVAQQVHEALTEWEPRIDVIDVDVDWRPEDESLLTVRIAYRVRATNAFHNLVYPLYLHEGARS
jgi:Bacteriophage baseplate protein W